LILICSIRISIEIRSYNINIQKAPHPSGTFIAAGHANQYVITDNRDANNVKRLSPSELATMIKEHPNYTPGDIIILDSCNTGTGGSDSYAQNLANSMGSSTVVYAPNNYLTASYRGVVYIGPQRSDGRIYYSDPGVKKSPDNYGAMQKFKGR
jgi:hypothetical protein